MWCRSQLVPGGAVRRGYEHRRCTDRGDRAARQQGCRESVERVEESATRDEQATRNPRGVTTEK
jgi:hypothetical protein